MHLTELQKEIDRRWGSASYHAGVNHKDHATLHLMKALGKIAASVEQTDHMGGDEIDVRKQIADLVICSSRLASLCEVSLEDIVGDRLAEKFPPSKEPPCGCGIIHEPGCHEIK